MQDQSKPILCLDFDGVLHSYASGWKGADIIPDAPVDGAEDFLRAAFKRFDVQVFSSRSASAAGRDAMQEWCVDHFEELGERLGFPESKPSAAVTLDDRAVRFDGPPWPDVDALPVRSWAQGQSAASSSKPCPDCGGRGHTRRPMIQQGHQMDDDEMPFVQLACATCEGAGKLTGLALAARMASGGPAPIPAQRFA